MRFRKLAYNVVVFATGLVILASLVVGCASQSTKWDMVEKHIKDAESFMANNTMKLVYPGDWTNEFKVQYEEHKRWIKVRDALDWAQGGWKEETK